MAPGSTPCSRSTPTPVRQNQTAGSTEPEWQLTRTSHGASRPFDLSAKAELREARHELLRRDDHLHAREVRSDAAVNTQAEGDVTVLLAVDDHLVGVAEYSWIAVRSREREQHLLPATSMPRVGSFKRMMRGLTISHFAITTFC